MSGAGIRRLVCGPLANGMRVLVVPIAPGLTMRQTFQKMTEPLGLFEEEWLGMLAIDFAMNVTGGSWLR